MVFYGPWQDGRIHEEIVVTNDPSYAGGRHASSSVLLSPEPTVDSGWRFGGWKLWHSTRSREEFTAGGITDPPPLSGGLSLGAFGDAMGAPVIHEGGGSGPVFTVQASGRRTPVSVGLWVQEQGWSLGGTQVRFGPLPTGVADDRDYAIPLGEAAATDEYYWELEPQALGQNAHLTVLEAEVLAYSSPDAGFDLRVNDAGAPDVFLAHQSPDTPTATEPETTSVTGNGGAATPLDLNVEAMVELQHQTDDFPLGGPGAPGYGKDSTFGDPRTVGLGVVYIGPALSDPRDDVGPLLEYWGTTFQIRLKYQWPRVRKVYYEDPTPPYRRITRRGDGLAGGARRVGNRTKTVQGSSRRGPGAIL